MRILWVKIGGLWPLTSGGRLRSFHIVSELARAHELTVLTTHGPGEDPDALRAQLPQCARVVSFEHAPPKWRSPRFPFTLVRSWCSPLPVDLWKHRVPALRHEVIRLLREAAVDLCVADFLVAAPNVVLGSRVPTVLFEHNVEYLIWQRLAATETRWWRPLLELEWRKMRDYEATACRHADLTVAVSATDLEQLRTLDPGIQACAVPTGVDVRFFQPRPAAEQTNQIVFTGSMDWQPNDDAMRHFIDAILPAIRTEIPEVALSIVGRDPGASLRAAAQAVGVTVTGTVDDVREHIARASVYVVPLRVGGGTRLKIFEALAMGKAVVSTTIGAEGLPLVDGEHFVCADTPAYFAQAVIALLRDPERRRRLGEAGRRLVEENYSWSSVAREFARACVPLVRARDRAADDFRFNKAVAHDAH